MSPRSTLTFALFAGSLIVIAIGAFFAATGESWGWYVAAFGAIDLATLPYTIRLITRSQDAATSQNPYARED